MSDGMRTASPFIEQVATICDQASTNLPDPALAAEAAALGARLGGPLRVAIAGRVKAGKSTLLNALVGERLAPTDAGECTRIVTWYERGLSPDVGLRRTDGTRTPARYSRDEGRLDVGLDGIDPESVTRIEVAWPSPALGDLTLIDTPGLASINAETSLRTEQFLGGDDEHASEADAVIYLMRHVHQRDVRFLDAFLDRSVAGTSPINAIGVLSRADEIGAGRLDALDSAALIAERYRTSGDLSGLCGTVVPVAGLLAETGETWREDEMAALRTLTAERPEVLEPLLVTADRFRDPTSTRLTAEVRTALLSRLGMFGVRFAVATLTAEPNISTDALADRLVAVSGVGPLRDLLRDQFLPRARVLQARAGLVGLRSLATRSQASSPPHADWLRECVDRIEASAHELEELRALHLAGSGATGLRADEVDDVRRVVLATTAAARCGLAEGAPSAEVVRRALEDVSRWRTRGSDPLANPAMTEVCEAMARMFEAIYAANAAHA